MYSGFHASRKSSIIMGSAQYSNTKKIPIAMRSPSIPSPDVFFFMVSLRSPIVKEAETVLLLYTTKQKSAPMYIGALFYNFFNIRLPFPFHPFLACLAFHPGIFPLVIQQLLPLWSVTLPKPIPHFQGQCE